MDAGQNGGVQAAAGTRFAGGQQPTDLVVTQFPAGVLPFSQHFHIV
jgi:hypothetical protein